MLPVPSLLRSPLLLALRRVVLLIPLLLLSSVLLAVVVLGLLLRRVGFGVIVGVLRVGGLAVVGLWRVRRGAVWKEREKEGSEW